MNKPIMVTLAQQQDQLSSTKVYVIKTFNEANLYNSFKIQFFFCLPELVIRKRLQIKNKLKILNIFFYIKY